MLRNRWLFTRCRRDAARDFLELLREENVKRSADLDGIHRKATPFLNRGGAHLPRHAGKRKTPIQVFSQSTKACQNLWTDTRCLTGVHALW